MKAGLLAVAALSAVAVALPHRRHEQLHEREVEIAWATEVDVVTATAPAAYVYVDQNGNPVSAPTDAPVVHGKWGGEGQGQGHHGHGPASTTAAPVVTSAPAPAPVSVAPVVASPAPVDPAPAPVVSIPAANPLPVPVSIPAVSIPAVSIAPVASSAAGASSGSGLGVVYSPYTTHGGPCRDAAQVASEIAALSKYDFVRLYGTDCNQIKNVLAAITPTQKVILGIFYLDGLAGELEILKAEVGDKWNRIEAITVGNEIVNDGGSANDVLSAVSRVRSSLAGVYSGPVSTADTVKAYQTADQLCSAGDVGSTKGTIYANIHPYFDGGVDAPNAGSFIQSQIGLVKKACGSDRNVIVSETGWPTGGATNGKAVPSVPMQIAAIGSIKTAFPNGGYYLLSAHDEMWKDPSEKFGVEQHWGLTQGL